MQTLILMHQPKPQLLPTVCHLATRQCSCCWGSILFGGVITSETKDYLSPRCVKNWTFMPLLLWRAVCSNEPPPHGDSELPFNTTVIARWRRGALVEATAGHGVLSSLPVGHRISAPLAPGQLRPIRCAHLKRVILLHPSSSSPPPSLRHGGGHHRQNADFTAGFLANWYVIFWIKV